MQAHLRTAADLLASEGVQVALVACLKTRSNSSALLPLQGSQLGPMRPAGTLEDLLMLQVRQLELVLCLQLVDLLQGLLSRGSVDSADA